jgi:hypothetical protein
MLIRDTAKYSLFFYVAVLCDKCKKACTPNYFCYKRPVGKHFEFHFCLKCNEKFNILYGSNPVQDDFEDFING